MQTKVSIVIPAFNEERLLAGSLRSIHAAAEAFSRLGWTWESIVCDNNSTDRTAEIARAAGARVVFEPVNQIGRARNTGAAHAGGEWIIFVDADSYPSAELFTEVAESMQSGSCVAGGSTVQFKACGAAVAFGIGTWNCISRLAKWAAGSFIFCEAAVFREVGGFNQDLYASEEIDLFKHLKRIAKTQGKRIDILYRHPLLTSDRKMRLYGGRDHIRFLAKMLFSGGRALRNRKDCYTWYDGRR